MRAILPAASDDGEPAPDPAGITRLCPCRPSRSSPEPTPTSTTPTSPGSPAHGGLADHRRPVLRRPRPVAAGPGGARVLGRRPDAPDDRAHRAHRRRPGDLRPGRAAPHARRGARDRPAGARGRPGVARRRAGAGRGHPRAPRRPGHRRGRPQHQPPRRTHPEPPRAVLPPDRRRADPDDRRRLVPAGGPAQRPRRLAAGRRRLPPPRRRREGRLRQPQRAVGLSPPRAPAATSPTSCWPT